MGGHSLPELLALFGVLIFSVILHEVAHGLVALWNGDPTARQSGRLTLNPAVHMDFFGTFVLPLSLFLLRSPVLFGWAKPVPYNPLYFRKKTVGIFTVAVAGVVTNFILAWGCAAVLAFWRPEGWPAAALLYGVSINLILAVFNLLPIPPLDGSKVLGVFLPGTLRRAYFSLERWGIVILFLGLATGWIQKILIPAYTYLLAWMLAPIGGRGL